MPDLTTELRKKADATAAGILEAARLDAEQISAEAEQRVASRRAASLQEEEAACRVAARSVIAAERHEAMRGVLLARALLVDRVLELATSLLPAATRTEAYLSSLPRQLESSMPFIGDKGAIIRCSPEVVPLMRDASSSHESTTMEPSSEMQNGFVLVSADGSVTVDKRLDSQLRRMKPTLAIEIHRRLAEL